MRRGCSRLICGSIRQTAQQHAHERWNFVNGHACGAHAHGVVPVRHNELAAISMPSHPQELAISPGVLHEDTPTRIRFDFSTHADSLLPPLHAVYRPTAEHRPSIPRHALTWIARNTRARAPVTLAGGESAQGEPIVQMGGEAPHGKSRRSGSGVWDVRRRPRGTDQPFALAWCHPEPAIGCTPRRLDRGSMTPQLSRCIRLVTSSPKRTSYGSALRCSTVVSTPCAASNSWSHVHG